MPDALALTPHARADLDELVGSFLHRHAARGAGTVSVWCGDTDGRPSYSRDELEVHYAASTMKLPLLVAAYRRHERGEIDLDAEVLVHNAFGSALDGSPYSLAQEDDQDDETWALLGSTTPLRRLVRHSVVKSGNLATNLVLEQVGAGEVATVLMDAGCSGETVLPRGIEDAAARESGLDNLVTAHDLALVMAGIASRTLAEEQTCVAVEEVLARQEHRDKVPAGLPEGTCVANKTGWVDGVTHDVALVRPVGGIAYVLAVCTTVDVPEEVAGALIAEVSRRVWEGREA
ncbi:MAG TPA: serine hydrolase [Nocardioidaceae bacterium]|nr:serine hydrolase [Nocardioidaceae bacterium]